MMRESLPRDEAWLQANQRTLMSLLAPLRKSIEAQWSQPAQPVLVVDPATERPADLATSELPPAAIEQLCASHALSAFERDLLLLCAGIELDAQFAALLQSAGHPRATFALALSVLKGAHWSALLPTGALRKNDLLAVGEHDTLLHAPLRITERTLHYLCGLEYADETAEDTRLRLDDLAQRIESKLGFADLVLPSGQIEIIKQIAAQRRQRDTVFTTWGFADKSTRGLGLSVMFHGPSGTGKTMAAEVLANELGLSLYRVDLSQVVNKYIGETEKNLRRIFDAAEADQVILLFDEADALFGKRSEVKDARDRYANIEVSYLLSRMESFQGLSILTTNLKSALDGAFLRRLRYVVEFPFPSAEQRAEIWQRTFPRKLPTRGVDYSRLSQLKVAGGTIKNIALNAAFLAADEGAPLSMQHLLMSARSECAKLERPLLDAEFGGWV